MSKRLPAVLVAVAFSIVGLFPAAAQADKEREVTVMTRNLYLGFDLPAALPELLSGDPNVIIPAVTRSFATVQATNFPERAQAIADEIADAKPDLVGLQEVSLWRSQTPADSHLSPAPNATHVEFDFLQILLAALAKRGLEYEVVAAIEAVDVEAPGLLPNGQCCRDIRLTQRDVLLSRSDVRFSNVQAKNFAAAVEFPGLRAPRSWISADVTLRGRAFRMITTHLELSPVEVQLAQAMEILAGPAATSLPVVLVCDCNSPADGSGATYNLLIASGFADAWKRGKDGFTCCQAEDLLNRHSLLSERIDFVLFRNGFERDDVEVVGDARKDRTRSGLWPSDHAGVVATLEFGPKRRKRDD